MYRQVGKLLNNCDARWTIDLSQKLIRALKTAVGFGGGGGGGEGGSGGSTYVDAKLVKA